MNKIIKHFICLLLIAVMLHYSFSVFAKEGRFDLEQTIEDIINWKKQDMGSSEDGYLINDNFLELVGTTPGDWYPIGLGRYNYDDNYVGYLAVVEDVVNRRYLQTQKLDFSKATEWHRISLAITAMGGDPSAFGSYNGYPINLIADGTYNRGLVRSPGAQGINGWIWSLIALDSKRYTVPLDAYHNREDMIVEILKQQLSDGGVAMSGIYSDPDITAMAIQALAPYYHDDKIYSYKSIKIKNGNEDYIELKKRVKDFIDEGLAFLSSVQLSQGDFMSWGMANVESTAQVLVALTSLGIDPLTDERFIKNDNTLVDGMMLYRHESGGFVHSYTYDSENPTSLPDKANSMATEQVLYALVSLDRFQNKMRSLYDMREDFSLVEREQIDKVVFLIDELDFFSTRNDIKQVMMAYKQIAENNRYYVSNYWDLKELMEMYEITFEELDDLGPYTVSFDTKGGSSISSILNVPNQSLVVLPKAPYRLHYNFIAWYKDQDYHYLWKFDTDKVHSNLTLYAKWEAKTYEISYMNADKHYNPLSYNIESPSFNLYAPEGKEGLAFKGWYNKDSGKYLSRIEQGSSGNLTLEAHWEIIDFSITYLNLENSTHFNPTVYSSSSEMIILSAPEEREHYNFLGWYNELEAGNLVEAITSENEGDLILYARWETKFYEIRLIMGENIITNYYPYQYILTEEDVPTIIEKEHYNKTPAYWDKNPNSHEVVADETFTLIYTANSYKIEFETNGGTAVPAIIGKYLDPAYTPQTPLRQGYYFAGWYQDSDLKVPFVFNYLTKNSTVYVKWYLILETFSEAHKNQVEGLPTVNNLTTKYYVQVTILRYLLANSLDFQNKAYYLNKVEESYQQILLLQEEIDTLNEDIQSKLHPYSALSLKDKREVEGLLARYNNLSEYDQSQINDTEILFRAKNKMITLTITYTTFTVVAFLCISLVVYIIIRRRKIKRRRNLEAMPESGD